MKTIVNEFPEMQIMEIETHNRQHVPYVLTVAAYQGAVLSISIETDSPSGYIHAEDVEFDIKAVA